MKFEIQLPFEKAVETEAKSGGLKLWHVVLTVVGLLTFGFVRNNRPPTTNQGPPAPPVQ